MRDVLDAIHDPDGRDLFDSIATEKSRNEIVDYTVKISRKQYCSRLSKLIKTDLVKRKGAKYVLRPFGNVIYAVQLEFTEAVHEHMESMEEMAMIIN